MADGISVNINSGDLQKLAGEAILAAIDQDKREALIKQALQYLLSKPSKENRYGSESYSPLEEAFHSAIRQVAGAIVNEELAKDDKVKEQVRQMLTDAWVKMNDPERYQKLVDRAADALSKAFIPDRF